jgi:hypothetical protein
MRGMIISQDDAARTDDRKELKRVFPGTDFSKCLFVEEGREAAGMMPLLLTLGGGSLLMIVGLSLIAVSLRSLWRQANVSIPDLPPVSPPTSSEPPRQAPRTVEQAFEMVGQPEAAFNSPKGSLVVGMAIALAMIPGGIALVIFAVIRWVSRWSALPLQDAVGESLVYGLVGLVGLLFTVGGVFAVRWMLSLLSLRVFVCPEGLVRHTRRELTVFPWADVVQVREFVEPSRLPIRGASAIPLPPGRSFSVHRRDGEVLRIDGDRVKKPATLAKMIRQACELRGITWMVVDFTQNPL